MNSIIASSIHSETQICFSKCHSFVASATLCCVRTVLLVPLGRNRAYLRQKFFAETCSDLQSM